MSVNKVFILGNLGADPELRYTPNQMAVCTLRIATNERRKSQSGEWTEHTEWHSVVVWGKTAENCSQYLQKGRQVFIEGRLQTRKWQDQQGQDRYRTEIIANTVQFVGGRGSEVTAGAGASGFGKGAPSQSADSDFGGASDMPPEPVKFDDDDIPF